MTFNGGWMGFFMVVFFWDLMEILMASGWCFQLLWKMMDFVSWEDEIPNWMENKNMLQTNNQLRIANIGPRALNFEPWSKRGMASTCSTGTWTNQAWQNNKLI